MEQINNIDMKAYNKKGFDFGSFISKVFSFFLGVAVTYFFLKGIGCSISQYKNVKGAAVKQVKEVVYHHPVIDQVNAERKNAGLQPVKINPTLMSGAYIRAKDLKQKNQWSHAGYEQAFTNSGYNGYFIGENLARNYTNDVVVAKWMQSPSHKKIILTAEFNEVGIGTYENYTVLWFGARQPAKVKKQSWTGHVSHYSRAGCLGCSENLTMANGEPLNDSRATIAFNWLPMNTKVKLTNLDNGKTIIATVTDTGGFNSLGRIADLTPAVANYLETKTDRSLVVIEIL